MLVFPCRCVLMAMNHTRNVLLKTNRITRSRGDINVVESNIKLEPQLKGLEVQVRSRRKPREVANQIAKFEDAKKIKREHVKLESDGDCGSAPVKPNRTPNNWEEVLSNLREMRKSFDAPVDLMGCQKCHDETASLEVIRYQVLLSLMLSSQTKDQVNYAAMKRLQEHGCTISNILETSDEKLGELIYPVSFWKNKTKYIKKTTTILKDDYNGDIPKTIPDLCNLPGVGPKMAHLCMKIAWNEVTGIGVDTHVHRITNRLGWVKAKTPEDTRKGLEDWLPKEYWSELNHLLVGFGQQICQPIKPQCETCLNNTLCPFGIINLKKTTKKAK